LKTTSIRFATISPREETGHRRPEHFEQEVAAVEAADQPGQEEPRRQHHHQRQVHRRPGEGDLRFGPRRERHVGHTGDAADYRERDIVDDDAELGRHHRVAELVQQHAAEDERHEQEPEDNRARAKPTDPVPVEDDPDRHDGERRVEPDGDSAEAADRQGSHAGCPSPLPPNDP
jgi:hypothetical protein